MNPLRPLAILLTALALPASAAAQDGVFVDPDSPSGKEYQIPLESARRQADPQRTDGKVVPGDRSAPLFGEGIEPDVEQAGGAAGGGGSTSDGGGGGSPDGAGSGTGDGSPAPSPPAEVQEAVRDARSRPAPSDGGVGTMVLVGGGLAVLLLAGGGAALAARRHSRPDPAR